MAQGQAPDRSAARRKTGAAGKHRGRRLSRRPRAGPRRANGSTPTTISPSSARPASAKLAGLRHRPQSLPRHRSVLCHHWPKHCGDLVLARGDGDIRASSKPSAAPISSSSTTSASSPSTATSARNPRRAVWTRSTIVTSQLPLSAWHAVIGDPTYADAILDRLVHNAHRIELTGESLRRKNSKTA